jgi:hypothetical protein
MRNEAVHSAVFCHRAMPRRENPVSRRTKKFRSFKRASKHVLASPVAQRVLSLASQPKSSLVFVVVCLFVVAINGAVQHSAWIPLPEEPQLNENTPESKKNTPDVKVEAPMERQAEVAPQNRTGWSFFHPTWRETPDLDLTGKPRVHPNTWTISDAQLSRWVNDPFRRMESDFQVTSDVRDRVLFWLRIHTQYSSQMRVIHDRNNPSIIYGIADFSELFRPGKTAANVHTQVYRYEQQILKELKTRLNEASGNTRTHQLTSWERGALRGLLSDAGCLGVAEAANAIGSIRSQTGQRDEFILALSRSEDLLPYIESTFRSFELPVALARIPFVESSFNARAYSKVGATGIFQFMPFTARQMIGADSNLWSDPLRQTRAAARMLIIFRNMLPDWSTTVTAYNSGVGRLQRLSRKYHTKSVGPLLDMKDATGLGFAGKNFYAQFLSANIAEAYRHEIFPLRKGDDVDTQLAFEHPRDFSRRFHQFN